MDKITGVKERVLQVAKSKGVSYELFFANIGMTYGNFKGKSKLTPLNSDAIADIITKYPDISADWLITGKGEMYRQTSTNEVDALVKIQQETILNLSETIKNLTTK